MGIQVNMDKGKSVQQLRIDAKKATAKHNLYGTKSQVEGIVDVSGSMQELYDGGVMDLVITRVLALALNLDDNGTVPMIALDNSARELDELNEKNLDGYVRRHVRPLVGGGTNYAPSINKVLDVTAPGDPALVLVFTDGENYDRVEAEEAIRKASAYPIFFQFFGIYGGKRAPRFPFLEELDNLTGRQIDNAGFSTISLTEVTDEQLYNAMLIEYPRFLETAKRQGMLPWNASNDPRSRGRGQQQKKRGWFR